MRVNKKDLISRATSLLHERDTRKSIPATKTKLHIRDDEGNESTFTVRREQKGYLLNEQDVSAVFNALMDVLVESMSNGDTVSVPGIGTLSPHYRAPRSMFSVEGPRIMSSAHLVPKYTPGISMKMAVKAYEQTLDGDFTAFRNYTAPESEEGTEEENGD